MQQPSDNAADVVLGTSDSSSGPFPSLVPRDQIIGLSPPNLPAENDIPVQENGPENAGPDPQCKSDVAVFCYSYNGLYEFINEYIM